MGLLHVTLLLFVAVFAAAADAQPRLKLATTTSTYDSGLLDILLPPFEAMRVGGIRVDVIAVGTGKALKLAENGDVDAVLVHAPKLEEAFVKAGFGVDRRGVMYNDFVVVGPSADQAGIAGTDRVADAFATIARREALFFSRGDLSGTHLKERAIWDISGIDPAGNWYVDVGQGMAATLRMADEKTGLRADRPGHLPGLAGNGQPAGPGGIRSPAAQPLQHHRPSTPNAGRTSGTGKRAR